jgi:predicted O-linked N-acetylglucosamine transferase (SPINDLY family)
MRLILKNDQQTATTHAVKGGSADAEDARKSTPRLNGKPGRTMKKALRLAEILQHGMAAHQQGRLAEAERSYRAALDLKRDNFDSLHLLGVIRWQQRRFDEASALIRQALRIRPDSAEACSNLGLVLQSLDRHADAIAAFDRALAVNPRYATALRNRGDALRALGRNAQALASYDKALTAAPDDAAALINRAGVLRDMNRHAEALAGFDRALAVHPGNREILYNRGNTLQSLGRLEDALRDYDGVLTLDPKAAEAHNNRGCVLEKLGRADQALASFEEVLTLKPDDAGALHNRGNMLLQLSRYGDAVASYDRALAIEPRRADTLHNRGQALMMLRRYDEAMAAFEAALALEPAHAAACAALANCRLTVCDWDNAARLAEQAQAAARAGDWSRFDPFGALCYVDSPADHLEYARAYVRRQVPVEPEPLHVRPVGRSGTMSDKIRIAYLSSDFRNHPVAVLTGELFERHDRDRFEVIGVSFGPDDQSDTRARLVKAFDQFHDVSRKNDLDIARLVRELNVHIAVDLNGHTTGARLGVLAHRPASIQVQYLGYIGTMGAGFIDYVIGDKLVLPLEQQQFYAEKIVHLPDCFQVTDALGHVPSDVPGRGDLGLPEAAFVFCCFNNSYKIMPLMFERWMRLLNAVPQSVLWLFGPNAPAMANLSRAAHARGIDPARLVFAPKVPLADYRARLCRADLFLDTLPYNAGATASDALSAGLPIVTCAGHSFAGRMGASLLNAVGLPDLVTTSLDDYEALALKLATDRALLDSIRHRLARNRNVCPLFDIDRTRRHIEAAYATMWDICLRGEPPRSFRVEPS